MKRYNDLYDKRADGIHFPEENHPQLKALITVVDTLASHIEELEQAIIRIDKERADDNAEWYKQIDKLSLENKFRKAEIAQLKGLEANNQE